jgi:hypothetical protein
MNVLAWFGEKFVEWFGWLGPVLQPMAHALIMGGGQVLITAAEDAVRAVETDPTILSSAGKRTAAFHAIVATLKDKGIPVIAQAVNAAIETTVTRLYPATTDPAPPAQ